MSKKNQKVLEVSSLYYTYANSINEVDILSDINFNLNKGEMVALVGPSGSGKSTFLNCIGTCNIIEKQFLIHILLLKLKKTLYHNIILFN